MYDKNINRALLIIPKESGDNKLNDDNKRYTMSDVEQGLNNLQTKFQIGMADANQCYKQYYNYPTAVNYTNGMKENPEYGYAALREQAKIDTKHMNETVYESVNIMEYNKMVLTSNTRNGNFKNVLISPNAGSLSVAVFRSKGQEDRIAEISLYIDRDVKKIMAHVDKIKRKKILEQLKFLGVQFNLYISESRLSEAVNTYLLRLINDMPVVEVPMYQGWYQDGSGVKFWTGKTWKEMEKECVI